MKKQYLQTIALLASIFLFIATGKAQSTTLNGVIKNEIQVKEGKISIYLPDDIQPGDQISGTVVSTPNGNSEKQVARNAAALATYSVTIANNQLAIVSGQVQPVKFIATAAMQVVVNDKKSAQVANFYVPIYAKSNQPANKMSIPRLGLTDSYIRARGDFDGDFSTTRGWLDQQLMRLVAESPRQMICSMPQAQSGQHTIAIEEKGTTTVTNISAVNLDLSAPKTNLVRGEKTNITVEVSGLQGTNSDIHINLTNTTPSTINLSGGNTQNITVAPSQISASGTYTHTVDVQSLASGSFVVNADLQLPETYSNGSVFTHPVRVGLLDGTVFVEYKDSVPTFGWSKSTSVPTPAKYRLRIVPVYPGQTTAEALAKNNIAADTVIYTGSSAKLGVDVPAGKSDPGEGDDEIAIFPLNGNAGLPLDPRPKTGERVGGGGQVAQPKPAGPKNNCDKELADLEAARNALKNAQAAFAAWKEKTKVELGALTANMAFLQQLALSAPKDKDRQQSLNNANARKEALNDQRVALNNAINAAAKDLSAKEDAYNKCMAANK